jgi:MYXO-CTERM domain-containing protein
MHHMNLRYLCLIPAVAFTWLRPAPASALLEECGAIELNEDVECQVEVEGGCEVLCDPSKLELACSGELYASCRADRCDVEVDIDCSATCTLDCSAECELDPGNFSCEGRCEASCEADCDAQCEASGDGGECAASCRATCSGECGASCDGDLPELDCEAKCAASCEGECRAEANVDCQVDCQAEGYLECESNMQDVCNAQCTRPEGVVICDGQFVNAADVNSCVGAIEAALDIEVEVHGSAEGECQGNECSGEAKGSVSCAVAPTPSGPTNKTPLGLTAIGVFGALALARRKRKSCA